MTRPARSRICPECNAREVPPPVNGIYAVRCSPCAVSWLRERGIAVDEPPTGVAE